MRIHRNKTFILATLFAACLSFILAVWGLYALGQVLVLSILPGLLVTAIIRKPRAGYWFALFIGVVPAAALASLLVLFTAESKLDMTADVVFWSLAMLIFLLLMTLRGLPNPSRLRLFTSVAFLWLVTWIVTSMFFYMQIGAVSSVLHCKDYKLDLIYDKEVRRFTATQWVHLQIPWKDEGDLVWSSSGRLLPLEKQAVVLEHLRRNGFWHWTSKSAGRWPTKVNASKEYILDIEVASPAAMFQVVETTLWTATTEFSLPIDLRRCDSTKITVQSPEYVILRHNVDGELRPTILPDGKDGVVLIGDGVFGERLRIRHAALVLQNAALASLAGLDWWKIPIWLFAILMGFVGFSIATVLDVLKEQRAKPIARRLLATLGIIEGEEYDQSPPHP